MLPTLMDVSLRSEVVYRRTSEGLMYSSEQYDPPELPEVCDVICPYANSNTHLFEIVLSLVLEEASSLLPSPGILPERPDEMRVYTLNSARSGSEVHEMLQAIRDRLKTVTYNNCRYLMLHGTLIISGSTYRRNSLWLVVLCSDPGRVKYLPTLMPAELEVYGDVASTCITFYTEGQAALIQNNVECLFYSGRSAIRSENPLMRLAETSGYSLLDDEFFCTPALWDKPVNVWMDILSEALGHGVNDAVLSPGTAPEEYVNVILKAVRRLVPRHIQRLILREMNEDDPRFTGENYKFRDYVERMAALMPGNNSMMIKFLPENLPFCTFAGVVPGVHGMSPERMELTVRYRYAPPFLDTSEMSRAEEYALACSIASGSTAGLALVTLQLDKGEKVTLCKPKDIIKRIEVPFHCETADSILMLSGIKGGNWDKWYAVCRKYDGKPVQDPAGICGVLDMLKLNDASGTGLPEISKGWLVLMMAHHKDVVDRIASMAELAVDETTMAAGLDSVLNSYFTHRIDGISNIGGVATLDKAYLYSLLALTVSHITMAEHRRNSDLILKLTNYYKRRKRNG